MYQATLTPVSNRADWTQGFELVDDDTDMLIPSLGDMSVKVEVREQECYGPVLSASTENGKVIDQGGGVFQWTFTRSEMSRLNAGTYEIGVTIERDEFTTQFLIGTLPVIDGVVSR